MNWGLFVLALLTAQRLAELLIARAHTKALLAQGAYEVGRQHYPLMIILHGAWLAGLWWFVWHDHLLVNWWWLGVFIVLQLGRVWVLHTLGARWTTRIIVLPGADLVQNGLFKYIRHPNYTVVTAEIAVLPIAFGLYGYAFIFSILNALVLTIRIRAEDNALRPASG